MSFGGKMPKRFKVAEATEDIRQRVETALSMMMADAMAAKEDAGYGGRMDDGGYSAISAQVNAYRAGMSGTIPAWLEPYMGKASKMEDPEYKEYLRLEAKFRDT